MKIFFRAIWIIISFPFRVIRWMGIKIVRGIKNIHYFLTFEPEDRPVTDALENTVKQPSLLLEHIAVLRTHLIRIFVVLIIAVGICAVFTNKIIDFLALPIGGIEKLQAIEVTETVGVFMRVAVFGGIALAIPYTAFEIWLFIGPGLSARARRTGLMGIPLAVIFFALGVYFSYHYILPSALPFLLKFLGIQTIPRVSSYIDFVTNLLFWIGIFFEFPLVIYLLALMGIVKPDILLKNWRIAVIVVAIIAAAVTPTTDPVNMFLVMAPMIVLYFFSILLGYIAVAVRKENNTN